MRDTLHEIRDTRMSKQIIVIGGGISGLSLLHYLKQKYASSPDTKILLLEKNGCLGGTIRSLTKDGCLFETGPNGFLDSKPRTLDFIHEVGLENDLVRASAEANIRYIALNNALYALPLNPRDFFLFSPLNFLDKLRVFGEILIPKGNDP